MKIHTRQTLANTAAERWKKRLLIDGRWRSGNCFPSAPEDTYAKLITLGTAPCPDMVDKIMGSPYWTNPQPCQECEKIKPLIVELGDELEGDCETLFICADCLQKALDAVKNEIEKEPRYGL